MVSSLIFDNLESESRNEGTTFNIMQDLPQSMRWQLEILEKEELAKTTAQRMQSYNLIKRIFLRAS